MPARQMSDDVTIAGSGEAAEPVRKSVRVKAGVARAFRVFTDGMDSWWPRTHHIGSSPMKRVVVEGRVGGSIYTEQEDGTACPWGTVLAWEPPHRFVMAWQVSPEWKYETNPARCSEVEVRFTPVDDGTTLVELEHRGFERHGGAYTAMREQVNKEGGWGGLLGMFHAKAEETQ
ncbi:MAG TPA: SRPBCC family protein [Acidobacteriaceae bacterium]